MKKFRLFKLILLTIFFFEIFLISSFAKIETLIIAKIDNEIVTNHDLKVESINLSSNLTVYRKNFGINEKEIIYTKFFDQVIKNNESIKIDYDTKKINNIYKPTFLEINNLNKKKINSITLVLKNEFDLNNFQILDNYQNCYYVR